MSLLPSAWRVLLDEVNREVNRLPYRDDAERYGQADFWAAIDEHGGDCEDYAIAKLNRLVECGFDPQRLRLATCWIGLDPKKKREYHAVLVVKGADDYYVLDNRFEDVVTVAALIGNGYELEKIQSTGGSREWVRWQHE